MAQNLRPIIDELKTKFANTNKEQIREAVIENIKQTRETVEKTLKEVAKQAKDSPIVHQYVIPIVESEKADQAFKFLNTKLAGTPVLAALEKVRQEIIDLKVSQAKQAEPVQTEATTATVETNSNDVTTEETSN